MSAKSRIILYIKVGEYAKALTDLVCKMRNVYVLWEQMFLLYVNVLSFKRRDFGMLSNRGL